jgi:hypothetical protein
MGKKVASKDLLSNAIKSHRPPPSALTTMETEDLIEVYNNLLNRMSVIHKELMRRLVNESDILEWVQLPELTKLSIEVNVSPVVENTRGGKKVDLA